METKHAPATPLPWRTLAALEMQRAHLREPNVAYAIHAVNEYPRLVDALRDLMLRCDGAEGVRADGSNIQTMQAHALLDEIGEG